MTCNWGGTGRYAWLGACAVVLCAPGFASARSDAAFNIPAGPAKTTIPAFARQSGLQVIARAEDLEGVDTVAVVGTFPTAHGLDRLLSGTNLTTRIKANGTVLIVRKLAQPPSAIEDVKDIPPTTVVVIGFRRSYADVVAMKRAAVGITDSISSDGMGRFPDLNAGEALQRVTGVQINREVEARNATINLRGMPGTFARTTINGDAFAEPILDSSTPLGAFNSDIFSAITINKSPAAPDQPGGLSGNIDLQIQPALSRVDGGVVRLSYENDELGNLSSPAATIGYNHHFSPDLAVFGIVAVKAENFRRDSINFAQYTPLNGLTPDFARLYADYYAPFSADGTCPSGQACDTRGTGLKGKSGVLFPSDNRQVIRYNKGKLLTAAAGIEFRPDDTTKWGVSGFYTRRKLDQNYVHLIEVDMRPTLTTVTPVDAPQTLPDGNTYINALSFQNPQVNVSTRSEPMVQTTWSVTATGDWQVRDWRLTSKVVYSAADNIAEQTQIDWRTVAQPGAGSGLSGTYTSGGTDISEYKLSLTPAAIVQVSPGPWTWVGLVNPPFLQNPQGDLVAVSGTSGYARNALRSAQIDVERRLNAGMVDAISGGVRLEQDEFTSKGYRTSAKGVQTSGIGSGFLTQAAYTGSFFGGVADDYLTAWPLIDYAYAVSQLQPVSLTNGDTLTATGWINDPTNGSYAANNFTVRNDIRSGYVTAKLNRTLYGVPVRALVGVRFEGTSQQIQTLNRTVAADGTFTYASQTFRNAYDNWLPSLLVAADVSKSVVLRFAAYKTFVRPQPRNLSPSTSVTQTSDGYNIAYGGFDLKPYTATSQDVSLEWYNRPGSLLSVAIFRKSIRDLVGPETRVERLCPADATAFGLGHLATRGSQCVSDVLIAGQPAVITATGSANQTTPVQVVGLETSVQQSFDFLGGIWKDFGVVANYSYTQIDGRNADGSKAVLPGVSENAYNLIGYYESPTFGVRVVYNYRDEYTLPGGNTFTGGASRVAARGQLDASISYPLNNRFAIFIDGFNLTNARRTQYQNIAVLPRANDYDGRTITVTLKGAF